MRGWRTGARPVACLGGTSVLAGRAGFGSRRRACVRGLMHGLGQERVSRPAGWLGA